MQNRIKASLKREQIRQDTKDAICLIGGFVLIGLAWFVAAWYFGV